MKKKLILLTLCTIFTWVCATAQTQHGIVKTIGRPGKPGTALSNVTIRMKGAYSAVLSDSKGHFSIAMPDKKDGKAIVIQSVYKKGYELKDKSIIGRPQPFSTTNPIEIVMVNSAQLIADKQRIERNAYKTAEKNYKKKLDKLSKQVKEREITAEQYRKELNELQNKYEAYQSLIGDMADRYARTDYDNLDSIDYQINICIENGELEKADSLILTVFDPETVLERNRAAKEEIQQRIEFAQKVINKANQDKEAILRDFGYALRVVELSQILADEYLAQGDKAKAIEYFEKSLEILLILYDDDNEQVQSIRNRIQSLET